jgi:hypothetical protein
MSDDWKSFYVKELCGILRILVNGLDDAIHDNSSFLEPAYQCLLDKMDDSYESLSEVAKLFLGRGLDPTELVLELRAFKCFLTRTEVESSKAIDRTVFEALFKEIYAVKTIFPTLWSVYQWIATAPQTAATAERSFSKLKLVMTR